MTPDELRQKRLRAFDPYIGLLASLMGLANWTIFRSDEPPSSRDAVASMEPIHGRYYAILRIGDYFLDRESPSEKRNTVVHELLHAHLSHLQKIAEDNLDDRVFPQFLLALEYAVDGMAKAWAERLPLPPEPRRKKG